MSFVHIRRTVHIRRKTNGVANYFAKNGVEGFVQGVFTFEDDDSYDCSWSYYIIFVLLDWFLCFSFSCLLFLCFWSIPFRPPSCTIYFS